MKACSKCSETKPLDEFYKNQGRRDGHSAQCKACVRAAVAAYRAANIEKVRERVRVHHRKRHAARSPDERWARMLWQKHHMLPDEWHSMWAEQGGMCYLSLHPLPENRTNVVVEHDHGHCGPARSCSVCRRGLACHNCNGVIGFFGDSPERLRIVADNLERAQARVRAALAGA